MINTAVDDANVPKITQKVEIIWWLKCVSYHASLITHHVNIYHRANMV